MNVRGDMDHGNIVTSSMVDSVVYDRCLVSHFQTSFLSDQVWTREWKERSHDDVRGSANFLVSSLTTRTAVILAFPSSCENAHTLLE